MEKESHSTSYSSKDLWINCHSLRRRIGLLLEHADTSVCFQRKHLLAENILSFQIFGIFYLRCSGYKQIIWKIKTLFANWYFQLFVPQIKDSVITMNALISIWWGQSCWHQLVGWPQEMVPAIWEAFHCFAIWPQLFSLWLCMLLRTYNFITKGV